MDFIEKLIVNQLFNNVEYAKRISPFLNINYVNDDVSKLVISKYIDFNSRYKELPNWENILYEISNDKSLQDDYIDENTKVINEIKEQKFEQHPINWIIDTTEKYFQDISLQKAILKGAEILNDEKKKTKDRHLLPDLMKDALKISFKNTTGKEYGTNEEMEQQYDYYHHQDRKFPFSDWPWFTNKVLRGGCVKKKLHIVMAATNVGKTVYLINVAKQYLLQGLNILYVSMEISEEEVIERIDACIMKTDTKDLPQLNKSQYFDKLKNIISKSRGRLIVKEYPTASANVKHLKYLLDELELKSNFVPDFIILDYINIFGSVRYSNLGDSYTYVKVISEELRGLCMEKNVGMFSATQSNRNQVNSSNIRSSDIAESFGTVMTVDLMIGMIETDELRHQGYYLLKNLKSRYAPITSKNEIWKVKVDKDKQIIEELKDPQEGLAIEELPKSRKNDRLNEKFEGFDFG